MLSKIRHYAQKQPFIGVLKKRCSENMHQIYRRMPMPQCDFSKVACNFTEIVLWHGCSPVNLRHISRTPFPKNISGGLLLDNLPSQIPTIFFWSLYWFRLFYLLNSNILQLLIQSNKHSNVQHSKNKHLQQYQPTKDGRNLSVNTNQ